MSDDWENIGMEKRCGGGPGIELVSVDEDSTDTCLRTCVACNGTGHVGKHEECCLLCGGIGTVKVPC